MGLLGNRNQEKFGNTAVKWWKLILERFIWTEQDDWKREDSGPARLVMNSSNLERSDKGLGLGGGTEKDKG